MEITESLNGKVLVVAVSGRLTADCAEQFKRFMNGVMDRIDHVVLDLHDMSYIDSTGLGAMVYALQKMSDSGSELRLACLQPKPRIVFDITKAYKVFDIYDTVDAAVEASQA